MLVDDSAREPPRPSTMTYSEAERRPSTPHVFLFEVDVSVAILLESSIVMVSSRSSLAQSFVRLVSRCATPDDGRSDADAAAFHAVEADRPGDVGIGGFATQDVPRARTAVEVGRLDPRPSMRLAN